MAGYTKLFGSILASTVWGLPLPTKVVWITMLAMAGRGGVVEASVPGLAKMAGVSVTECEEALAAFLATDPYSRTKDYDGRRIEEIDGGWRLLTFDKHRNTLSPDDIREKAAERQQRWRDAHAKERNGKALRAVTIATKRHNNDIQIQIPSSESEIGSDQSPRGGRKHVYEPAFEALWKAVGETGNGKSLGHSIKLEAEDAWKAVGRPTEGVPETWAAYVRNLPDYQTTPKHFGRWLKKRCFEQSWEAAAKPARSRTVPLKPNEQAELDRWQRIDAGTESLEVK